MYAEEETTRLEFVSKTVGQTYIVDSVVVLLTTEGYDNSSNTKNADNRGNTALIVSIDNDSEFNEEGKQIKSPSQRLNLNFQYSYATPYQDHNNWVYDLNRNESNKERKARHLQPDFFRVTQDDHWVTVEWLSYTRKETYGGTSTSNLPDGMRNSLNIPIHTIISVQAIKNHE
jgi:hypothetical protein